MSAELKITFQPSGRSVYVIPGTILLEAAARAGHILETPCGGMGRCGKCVVRIAAGDCAPCAESRSVLSEEQIRNGYRLACRCKVCSELKVEIPETSLFRSGHQILSVDTGGAVELKPTVRRVLYRPEQGDRSDERSDAEKLCRGVDAEIMDLAALRDLPVLLRDTETPELSVGLVGRRVVDVTAGAPATPVCGMAFDIGTTTLVGTLVDLESGRDLQVVSMINPQTSYGDDVISRIKICREKPGGVRELHGVILGAVNELIGQATEQAGVSRSDVRALVFAGNTTMQQILCGIDPRALGELPFSAAFRDMLVTSARELEVDVHPSAEVRVFPQIGGFVGGDTVAGILATQLDSADTPTLLVDVGTNGEIVLACNGRLIATSVAAGPAFEGARIVNGMRATRGAIEKVVFNDEVRINVIGDAPPSGLCGTGLIDAVAAMLRAGILDETGRILGPDELPEGLSADLRRRVVAQDGQFDFVLVDGGETAGGEPLRLYQRDIREVQLANGAIRAGIMILLDMAGMTPGELGSVLLAGAFGNFIRRSNALRIGMLPDVPHDRIRFVGNTASFGAKRVLLSSAQAEVARQILGKTEHVDLSLRPDFQMAFSEAMMFPG